MKFNLKNEIDKKKFKDRCNKLFEDGEFVELKKINLDASLSQMKYVHVIIGQFALEYGETIEYVKEEIFKKQVNKQIFETKFVNRKTGKTRIGLRSMKALDKRETTETIERFRDYASKEASIYLPTPNEKEFLKQCQIDMDRVRQYL